MPGAPEVIAHPRIKEGAVARRDYQVAIAHEAGKRNTLVILPTGMGKTVVALLAIAHRLDDAPGKILLLAPTKPLVEQHSAFFASSLLGVKVETFTGETPPEERELAYKIAGMICSTPQVVQNDIVAGRFDLGSVSLVVFDESHRAVGNYAYVFIAEAYRRARMGGRVLAMTASPGAKAEKIREVCQNLGIDGVEVRTEMDADTAPYVQDTDVEWKTVAVPESLKQAATLLRAMYDEAVQTLRMSGGIPPHMRFVTKKVLLDAQRLLQARLRSGETDGQVYKALSAQAAALKLGHAVEMIETQGVGATLQYIERLMSDESKAAKAIVTDPRTKEVVELLGDSKVDHPKLRQVAILLRQQLKIKADSRILVFTNFRDTAEALVEALAAVEGVRASRFVGQASRSETDKGMSQKKQVELIERFKGGEFNVLVATSVAEEGLDIPQVDLVVFYEPVPSEIRAIQRRGRTGRKRAGRVVILITKDTRDETYHFASRGKEKKMAKEIDALKKYFRAVNASQDSDDWRKSAFVEGGAARLEKPLDAFETQRLPDEVEKIVIIADQREFNSAVVRELSKLGVIVRPETLAIGDYVLSDRVAVERKEAEDFARSLADGRLFPQARALRDAYSAPLVVIEGEGLLAPGFGATQVYGALAALSTDLRVSVFTTKDPADTAQLLAAIAKREQLGEKRPLKVRNDKGPMSEDERLRFLVEGLPNVSAVLSRRLLEHFGTMKAIADASVEELMEVEGVGELIAGGIHRTLRSQYVGRPSR
ncbi:MAG TPA: DEAD/DEAH box helicase [Candidatus Thermoplasmatota archaeon]|nr:DEAD/DEAH box helicase [Candidatus Thermoplasmatota archaeon]